MRSAASSAAATSCTRSTTPEATRRSGATRCSGRSPPGSTIAGSSSPSRAWRSTTWRAGRPRTSSMPSVPARSADRRPRTAAAARARVTLASVASPRGSAGDVDDRAFRNALGRFATGVIVMTAGPRRRPHAMTANAFMSGSLQPPLVVVSVGRPARMHQRPATARRFGVSILDRGQEPASRYFAGQAVPRFSPTFGELAGVVVLAQAAVRIAARIEHRYECGDHTLYVGCVEALAVHEEAQPLLYYHGRYRALQPAASTTAEPYPSFF